MTEDEICLERGFSPLPAIRFEHPISFEDLFKATDVAVIAQRLLNCVDPRLVDHGFRVAKLLDAMLEVDGSLDSHERGMIRNVALLHDVGAYHTEEIDRMVMFETNKVWEHSFYGYLFFRELSPFAEYADIVLYHHMANRSFTNQDAQVQFLSQSLQVADRIDVLLMDHPEAEVDDVFQVLMNMGENQLSIDAIRLFVEAEKRFDLLDAWHQGRSLVSPLSLMVESEDNETAATYLDMLVHVIDFRSRHTVAHTVTTAWVAYELGIRMLPAGDTVRKLYVSALMHDLGKIGIPLSILENPGKLDEHDMAIMRTHVTLTEQIIGGCIDEDIVNVAVRHHEKLDGSGYPRGLPAEQLTLPDRIITVADMVSALVGTRSYKEAYPQEKVVQILSGQRDRGLIDCHVVEVMIRDYTEIMQEVDRACRPVEYIYQRVQDEYVWFLGKLHAATDSVEPSDSCFEGREENEK